MHTQQSPEDIVVEAADLETALAEVAQRLGPEAEIVDAQKVHKGGLGGFFAKELVQVTARVPAAMAGVAGAIDALVDVADGGEADFREVLREQMIDPPIDPPVDAEGSAGPDPRPVGPMAQAAAAATGATDTVAPSVPVMMVSSPIDADIEPDAPAAWLATEAGGTETAHATAPVWGAPESGPPDWRADDGEAPEGMGRVDWSATALARIGLPTEIVEATKGLDPRDDLAWVGAIARAVAPLCGALPDVPMLIVGAHADRLAEPLDVPLVNPPGMPPYSGSVCAVVSNDQRDLDWLRFVRGDRKLHLVVGEDPWRELLVDDPLVVSWSGDRGVIDAIYLASTLGGSLGYGTVDGFASGMVRARPVDVALAVRRLVGRR